MSVLLSRATTLETVEVENFTGIDGEGAPSYASPVEISVRAVRKDEMVTGNDGSEIKIGLTLYVPPDESLIPGEQDRVTHESETFIGVEQMEVKNLKNEIDHVRLKCRRE